MKKVHVAMMFAAATAIMMTGCKSSELAAPAVVEEPEMTAPAVIIPGATVTEDGAIVFSAEGQSVAKVMSPLSVAKAEAAAATIAKANLLEVVKGALVSSSVKVSDMVLAEQAAEKKVYGWLARATIEIIDAPEAVVEKTNLPAEPDETPEFRIVTAIASLTLAEEDLANFKPFVE